MPTSKRPTITDVAKRAGVSIATASKALNDRDRVDPMTRRRVQRAAAALGYRPNVRAQRLRSGRSESVALITALPASIVGETSQLGFLLDLALPIAQVCLTHGYSLLLVPPVDDPGVLDGLDIDGAVVVDPSADDQICARLRDRGVRVVTLGRSPIATDGFLDRGHAGVDVMLAHLAARGAQHIAVLLSSEPYPLTIAARDYLAAAAHLHGARCSIIHASARQGQAAGQQAAEEALRADASIDAVYAPLDAFAIGVLNAARGLGRRIPEDLMVATNYDGRRAALADPPLTALDLQLPKLGRGAAELLFRVLNGQGHPNAIAPTPQLVVRASTTRAGDLNATDRMAPTPEASGRS